jgi:predicted exporter
MRALLRGGYEGALDVLFNRPDVQQAMGDELPWELWGVAEELPERWQRQILERFNERFREDPPFNMQTHQWLRTLASIPVTDEVTAETMLRTWNRLGRGDHQQRYLLLQAMSAAPVAAYEPILAKYAKSRRFDIRDFARAGLAKLKGEA